MSPPNTKSDTNPVNIISRGTPKILISVTPYRDVLPVSTAGHVTTVSASALMELVPVELTALLLGIDPPVRVYAT